jgi:ferrous iron transport protein A
MQKRKSNVLSELKVGQTAVVSKLNLPAAVQHHLMHMGIMPEATILALRRAPAGDPTVYAVDGIEVALRRETAESIVMRPTAKLANEEAL